MPKIIDLVEVKKRFDEKATENQKKSYDKSKDKDEFLKKWNRTEVAKNKKDKPKTKSEIYLSAVKELLKADKLHLNEIESIEAVMKNIKVKLDARRKEAEVEAREAKVKELNDAVQAADEAAIKAKKEADALAKKAEETRKRIEAELNEIREEEAKAANEQQQ